MQPKISFVVVTHNRPVELVTQRIIKSIYMQDYPRIELILIGESNETIDQLIINIEKKFKFEDFKWKNVPRPEGEKEMCIRALVARCRNKGILLASGEYISCQDDDNELKPDFASSLLECIQKKNADTAWCYREMKFPDGSPYMGDYVPWFQKDHTIHQIIYRMWKKAGVIIPGHNTVRDELCARCDTQIFSTVDANEWLVKADIFRQFPFKEKFSYEDLCSDVAFDDLWNIAIRNSSVKAVCSERVSLIYYLGGMSNTIPKTSSLSGDKK
ncbi:MAG: glycosyltransferase [Candidatus Aminicenantes bacterium]|jgi:glycosyltransferase involved in cell wall biosynthesis